MQHASKVMIHVKRMHINRVKEKIDYVCNICNLSFKHEGYLKNHLRKGHQVYKCEKCNNEYKTKYIL